MNVFQFILSLFVSTSPKGAVRRGAAVKRKTLRVGEALEPRSLMAFNPLYTLGSVGAEPKLSAAAMSEPAAVSQPTAASLVTAVPTPAATTWSGVAGPLQKDNLESSITATPQKGLIDFGRIDREVLNPSVAAAYDAATGRLTVRGTAADDSIRIVQYNGGVAVLVNNPKSVFGYQPINIGMGFASATWVDADNVRSINVDGGAGHDRIAYEFTTTNPLPLIPLSPVGASSASTDKHSLGLELYQTATGLKYDFSTPQKSLLYSAERLFSVELSGGEGNDKLELAGRSSGRLLGGAGTDTLTAGAGDDALIGGDGNDFLYGNDGVDWLFGDLDTAPLAGTGHDKLYGGAGADFLYGHGGNDFLYGEAGDDFLVGGNGNDSLYGSTGVDTMWGDVDSVPFGGSGIDHLYGGENDDVMHGQGGNDFLSGDAGNDTLHGEGGVDTLYGDDYANPDGGTGADRLFGGDHNDKLYGQGGDDFLSGDAGHDVLYGNAGKDTLYGDVHSSPTAAAGNDVLYGGAGNDSLYGQGGNDRLFGEADIDRLFGEGDVDWVYRGGNAYDARSYAPVYPNAGNDWLEAGSAGELAQGGAGDDFNAHVWTNFGDNPDDIVQGRTGSCILLASLASASRKRDLSTGITYLGNYNYLVKLFDRDRDQWVSVPVRFDGTTHAWDAGGRKGAEDAPGRTLGTDEFWVTLYQRAYAKHFHGIDPMDTTALNRLKGEDFEDAMEVVIADDVDSDSWGFLNAGVTPQWLAAKAATQFVTAGGTGHRYMVGAVNYDASLGWVVSLYNPWGNDGTHNGMSVIADSVNDGWIRVTWSTFEDKLSTVYYT